MKPTFSLVVNHTPWVSERVIAKATMLLELLPLSRGVPFLLHDADYRDQPWQEGGKLAWILAQWRWAVQQDTTHHLFLTDDLNLAPRFWDILGALVEAAPASPIGLLSNHPSGPALAEAQAWYATNSWLVGPAYVLPHATMLEALAHFESLPMADKLGPHSWNDDSFLNFHITTKGPGRTLHPLPTIIEHRVDLASTVGHGDRYSRERLSWRERRTVVDKGDGDFSWRSELVVVTSLDDLLNPKCWRGADSAPLLSLP